MHLIVKVKNAAISVVVWKGKKKRGKFQKTRSKAGTQCIINYDELYTTQCGKTDFVDGKNLVI